MSPIPIIGICLSNSPVEPPSSVVQTITSMLENAAFKPTSGFSYQSARWGFPPTTVESPVPPPKTTTRTSSVGKLNTSSLIFCTSACDSPRVARRLSTASKVRSICVHIPEVFANLSAISPFISFYF